MTEKERKDRHEFMEGYRKMTLAQQHEFWKEKMVAPGKRFKIVRDIWLVSDPPRADKYSSDETAIAHIPSGLWCTQKMSFDDVVTKLETEAQFDEQLLQMMQKMDADYEKGPMHMTDQQIDLEVQRQVHKVLSGVRDQNSEGVAMTHFPDKATYDALHGDQSYSFEDWQTINRRAIAEINKAGYEVKPRTINIEDYHKFLAEQGVPNCSDAREFFIGKVLTEEGEEVKHQGVPSENDQRIDHHLRLLQESELLKRYYQHMQRGELNTRPEHAFGAKLYASMICFSAARGHVPVVNGALQQWPNEKRRKEIAFRLGAAVHLSEIYLWASQTERIADECPLPEHTVSHQVLNDSVMFWVHEGALRDTNNGAVSSWMLLLNQPDSNSMLVATDCFGTDDDPTYKLVVMLFDYGKLWPRDYSAHFGQILKRCAFLRSPYVTTARQRLPHHIRRQIERGQIQAGENALEDQIRVVMLRRAQVRPAQERSDQPVEPREVEWQHQWWVKRHYRAQWYPSEQAHRVIYIESYLKGPRDKPILEKIYSVVR